MPKPSAAPPDFSTLHPTFRLPWITTLLCNPDLKFYPLLSPITSTPSGTSNTIFRTTLTDHDALIADLTFTRPTPDNPASITGHEHCFLISVGSGVDGKTGRAHGGFSTLVLDQVAGICASEAVTGRGGIPATVTITVDFKAPVDTPGVVLCRAWATRVEGRKTWVEAVLEDGEGRVLTTARGLFIVPRAAVL